MAFIAIQCPSCASTDVTLRGGGHYQCNHCNTAFMRKEQPQAPPPPPPPPRPLSTPINSYGPPPMPTVAPQPVHHVGSVPTARFRWGLWLFIMLTGFGGPLIAAGVSFLQVNDATQAATRAIESATQPAKPKSTEQVVPRKASATLGSSDAAQPGSSDTPAAGAEKQRGEGTSLEGFQRLQGCSCTTESGDVDLYTRHEGGGTTITGSGTTYSMELSFALKVGNTTPFTLPLRADTSPASSFTRGNFPLGIGCEDDTVVIATLGKLTGWSIEDRSERWTVDLPQSYGEVEPGNEAGIDCKSVAVRGGTATIELDGAVVKAELATGTLDTTAKAGEAPKPETKPSSKPESKPEPEPETKPEPEPETKPTPKPEPIPEPSTDATKAGKKKKGKKKKGKKK